MNLPELEPAPDEPAPTDLPESSGIDPMIYEVFDRAIALAYKNFIQVRLCWRELLAASEKHARELTQYAGISKEGYEAAVNLAALSAAAEMEKMEEKL